MKDLIKVANELNEEIGCDPAIPTDEESFLSRKEEEKQEDMSDKDFLLQEITSAAEIINLEKDSFTLESINILVDLELWPEDDPSESIKTSLMNLIEEALQLPPKKALAAVTKLVKKHDEFKSMRKDIVGKFNSKDIAKEMFILLGVELVEEPEDVQAVQEVVKEALEKEVKNDEGKKKAKKKKEIENAGKPHVPSKREGSMAHFADAVLKAGGTWEEMWEMVFVENETRGSKAFHHGPQFKAHLKFRLKNDPNFLEGKEADAEGIS